MKAVILAAGLGSRLRPITDEMPKAMVPVNEVPIIDRMIKKIAMAGVKEVVVVTGYMHDKLLAHLSNSKSKIARNAVVVKNDKYDTWGNFYSLLVAKEAIGGADFIKFDGDVVLDDKIIPALLEGAGDLVLAIEKGGMLSGKIGAEEMKIGKDDDGRVVKLSKKIDPRTCSGESIGIEKVSSTIASELFAELEAMIADEETDDYYERAYQRLIDKGLTCGTVDITDHEWYEIDTIEDLKAASRLTYI